MTRRTTALLAVFVLAAAVRIVFALTMPAAIVWPDGERYVRVADNLRTTGSFGSLRDNAMSVPTQPVFLAGVFAVAGRDLRAARVASATIGALTCVIGAAIAWHLFSPLAGIVVGVVLALYPHHVYLAALFEYPQTLFMFFLALFFWALTRVSVARAAGGGLALGCAAATVPAVLPLAFITAVWLAWRARAFGPAILLACLSCVPLGAWAARNAAAYHRFMPVNAASGFNLWKGNNDTYYLYGKVGTELATGSTPDPRYSFFAELREVDRAVSTLGPEDAYLEHDRLCHARAIDWITHNPGRFATLTARKFLALWSPVPDPVSDNAQLSRGRVLLSIGTYGPLLLVALVGIALSVREAGRFVPYYAYLLVMSAAYAVLIPTTRYRLPLDFVLVLFAANAVFGRATPRATARR